MFLVHTQYTVNLQNSSIQYVRIALDCYQMYSKVTQLPLNSPVALYLTVREAAKVLGIEPDAVYVRIQQGILPTKKRGRCDTIYVRLYCV